MYIKLFTPWLSASSTTVQFVCLAVFTWVSQNYVRFSVRCFFEILIPVTYKVCYSFGSLCGALLFVQVRISIAKRLIVASELGEDLSTRCLQGSVLKLTVHRA